MKYIAFLDILGFKELVENNSLSNLTKIYRDVIKKTYALSFGVFEKADVSADVPDASVKSVIISDSIILWTEKDNSTSFFSISITVQCMLYISLAVGIPLRGAIVRGELSQVDVDLPSTYAINSPVILGKGLVEAYRLEGTQNWSGCIISDECMRHALINSKPNELYYPLNLAANGLFTAYDVPVKGGSTANHFCINWPMTTGEGQIVDDEIRAAFGKHNKLINSIVEAKIKNTIDFNCFCWDLPNRGYVFKRPQPNT